MTGISEKLEILYDLLVDNFEGFRAELEALILSPEKIKNTNKFASLLSELNTSYLITPLLLKISISNTGDKWLTDFMYAAINLLAEASDEDEFEIPEGLLEKLQTWVLEYQGEISWKAASLLKFSDSDLAEQIQLKKLEQHGDFFLTYTECVSGLLWHHGKKHAQLIHEIAKDESRDEKLREFINKVIKKYI
ncbi:hypothetical protein [Mucilaginibacter kameinonensis]|uniref:hypothetical protein n=1 Tax=Mucilaginibacter kameinonensis TaxID=452286 RepID=UPI000EF78E51|nr:hypothetical protein [Mucilaginibacter kameinonensis]